MQDKQRKQVRVSQVIGELMLTIGVLLLLFAYYESYWTNIKSAHLQSEATHELEQQWQAGTPWVNPRGQIAVNHGSAFAQMYIPAFGSDFRFAIVEGTGDDDLVVGPGRYTDSQLPGQKGNFAVAGHRVGKGAPFNDLGNLHTCDAIVVETQKEWIIYRVLPIDDQPAPCLTPEQQAKVKNGEYSGVSGLHITSPTDVAVINPVPGSSAVPTESLLTLTTCHPQFSNAERMIVHAIETEIQPKQPGVRPAVLEAK